MRERELACKKSVSNTADTADHARGIRLAAKKWNGSVFRKAGGDLESSVVDDLERVRSRGTDRNKKRAGIFEAATNKTVDDSQHVDSVNTMIL